MNKLKKLKSQKGVTMISLMLYVASFAAITLVVGGITTFFYSNMQVLDDSIGSNSGYNKLNLYLLNECKKPGASIYAFQCIDAATGEGPKDLSNLESGSIDLKNFITLKSDNGLNSFIFDDESKCLYYNSIVLCQNVEKFQLSLDKSSGKDVLSVLINIDGTAFQTKYVVGL